MKPSSILLLIFCCIAFSSQAGNGIIHLTDSNYAVIPYTKSESYLFKNAKATSLCKAEIQGIETLLNKCIDEHNKEVNSKPIKWGAIEDIGYKVQLIPVTNNKGEKEVWINCFCESVFSDFWRKGIIRVCDGGSCYFNLKINLTTQKFYNLMINGEA